VCKQALQICSESCPTLDIFPQPGQRTGPAIGVVATGAALDKDAPQYRQNFFTEVASLPHAGH
jgi:hypothetical protein